MESYYLKRISTILFLLIFWGIKVKSQTKDYPKIGDTVPNFILKDLNYSKYKHLNSAVFKGKPLIIDFFSVGCKACFESFPEVNSLKKEFEGKVEFILIAKQSPGLQKQYEKYMNHYGLSLPVDYDDSTIWNQFGVLLVPYTVWVDQNGVIKQITTSFAMTKDRINNFIQGKSQSFAISVNKKDDENKTKGIWIYNNFYDNQKPLLMNGNGGPDSSFLFRSLLCKWDYKTYFYRDLFISSRNKNRIQEIGVSLNILFNLAYGDTVPFLVPLFLRDIYKLPNHYGQWATYPLVESRDSAQFFSDADSSKRIFSYSLMAADTNISATRLQRMMQRDLANYFNKTATVEWRKMPCWKIIAENNTGNICKTKGGEPEWEGSFSGFRLQNQPMNSLLVEIWGFFQMEPVFIDDTGINYNIDLKIDAVMTDIHDIQKALQKYGLNLVKGEKEMKVIVVRNIENE